MENIFHFTGLLVVLLLAFAGAVPSPKSSILIGDNLYFTDPTPTLRSFTEARSYCRLQEAELAKVTNKTVYDRLRVALPLPSTYWVDGMDKANHERFALDMSCSPGHLDYSGMSPNNLALAPKSCLAIVKGTTAANSRIEAIDCIIPNKVLCSFPINGCMPGYD